MPLALLQPSHSQDNQPIIPSQTRANGSVSRGRSKMNGVNAGVEQMHAMFRDIPFFEKELPGVEAIGDQIICPSQYPPGQNSQFTARGGDVDIFSVNIRDVRDTTG